MVKKEHKIEMAVERISLLNAISMITYLEVLAMPKDHHDQFSAPNVKECSMVGSEKASRGVQLPRPDEISAYNFTPANRFFSGISSVDRNDGSPPIFVSTPEKVDEKIPEDVYS